MKISIDIRGNISHSLVIENNLINNNKKVSDEEINNLIRIIRLWKNEYGTSNIIDALEYTINVDGEVIHGKGIFPSNFSELLDWINKNA